MENRKPILTFHNVLKNRSAILRQLRGLIGVYRWTNLITLEDYFGSSKNLGDRLGKYYSPSSLLHPTRRISNSMRKYGLDNFKLDIMEICATEEEARASEQDFLDNRNKETSLNIRDIASGPGAYTPNEKAAEEKLARMRLLNLKRQVKVSVTDTLSDPQITTVYNSMIETAKALGSSVTAIRKRNGKLLRNRYLIIIIGNGL